MSKRLISEEEDDSSDSSYQARVRQRATQSAQLRNQTVWVQQLALNTTVAAAAAVDSKETPPAVIEPTNQTVDLDDSPSTASDEDDDNDDDVDDKVPVATLAAPAEARRLTFLPIDTVVGNIAEYLSIRDLLRYCATDPTFAYRFCGAVTEISEAFDLDDEKVVWPLWKNLLLRDFGMSNNPDECVSDSVFYRALTASAVNKFIEHEIAATDADVAEVEPNRTRLLAYKRLHELMYNSMRFPVQLRQFRTTTTLLLHNFTLDNGVVSLSLAYGGKTQGTILVSVVALVNAYEDLRGGRFTRAQILAKLRRGGYGRVFWTPFLLEATTNGDFVERNPDVVYKVPRERWLALDAGDDEPISVGDAKARAADALPGSTFFVPFLNDAGNTLLFDVHFGDRSLQGGALAIEQYRAESLDEASDELTQTQTVVLANELNARVTYGVNLTQTEKTYMTIADRRYGRHWYSRDAEVRIHKFSDGTCVFRLAIADLIERYGLRDAPENYRLFTKACVHRQTDGFAGCHILLLSTFIALTAEELVGLPAEALDPPGFDRRFYLIKINLDADGNLLDAKLYIVPRVFVQATSINVISSRFLSVRFFALGAIQAETAVIDWQLNTITYVPPGRTNPYSQTPVSALLMIPTLTFSNYDLPDIVPLPLDDGAPYHATAIQQYTRARLQPISLPADF